MREHVPAIVSHSLVFIDDLLRDVEQGRIRIPRFQRGFVWKPSQILELLESVNKGYPIGSLVFWDTDAAMPLSADRLGPLDIPAAPPPGITSYVIDGLQRIAVLYCTLRLPPDFPNDDSRKHWQWWVYYDLRARIFKHIPGGQRGPQDMPVRVLLKTRDFLRESRSLVERLGEDNAAPLLEEAESLAQRLRSYKIPVMHVRGEDPGAPLEIFSRLNTTGRPLDIRVPGPPRAQEGEPADESAGRGSQRRRQQG